MRVTIVAVVLVLTAGCSSAEQAGSPPSSSAPATTSTAPATTTALSSASFRSTWAKAMEVASPREECQGADAFQPPCFVAMEGLVTAAEQVAKASQERGGAWIKASLVATEVGAAAKKWNDECITQTPEVRSQRGCLPALFAATGGADRVTAELVAAEQG